MSKKWYAIYALAFALLPVFLLLVVRFESPSEIIVPPGFYGETAEVQAAFEASLPAKDRDNITLKYPSAGDFRTAFVMKNLDSDDTEEVIVFYTLKSDESTVRMNVLDRIDDEWQSVYDEPGYGSEIISVIFDDLNKDGNKEIICSWSLYQSQTSKVMTVHSANSVGNKPIQLKTLVTQSYSFSGVADMDNDGYDEIMVIWSDSDESLPKMSATLLKMHSDDTMVQMGQSVTLDSAVSSYATMKLQDSENGAVAFIDAYKGQDAMITEILWWDSEKQTLVAPCFDAETLSNNVTLRSPVVSCADIDSDGMIEIPVNLQNVSTSLDTENTVLTKWMNMTADGLVVKSYSFVNASAGFYYNVSEYLSTKLTASITESGVMTIYLSNDGINRGDPLFSLVRKKRAELTDTDTYTFIKYDDDYVVFGTLTSAGEQLGFTNEMIRENISFISEGV